MENKKIENKKVDNIIDIINSLPNKISLKPATQSQITAAESKLNIKFSDEYKKYLSVFGAIIANGLELTGITKSKHRNVVYLTNKERTLNSKIPRTMYVIEDTHIDGIIIWQDTSGSIYKTQYESSPEKIASSLLEYISSNLKNSSSEDNSK